MEERILRLYTFTGLFLIPPCGKMQRRRKKVSDHHGHLKLPYRVEFSIPFHPYFLMVMSGEKNPSVRLESPNGAKICLNLIQVIYSK